MAARNCRSARMGPIQMLCRECRAAPLRRLRSLPGSRFRARSPLRFRHPICQSTRRRPGLLRHPLCSRVGPRRRDIQRSRRRHRRRAPHTPGSNPQPSRGAHRSPARRARRSRRLTARAPATHARARVRRGPSRRHRRITRTIGAPTSPSMTTQPVLPILIPTIWPRRRGRRTHDGGRHLPVVSGRALQCRRGSSSRTFPAP